MLSLKKTSSAELLPFCLCISLLTHYFPEQKYGMIIKNVFLNYYIGTWLKGIKFMYEI